MKLPLLWGVLALFLSSQQEQKALSVELTIVKNLDAVKTIKPAKIFDLSDRILSYQECLDLEAKITRRYGFSRPDDRANKTPGRPSGGADASAFPMVSNDEMPVNPSPFGAIHANIKAIRANKVGHWNNETSKDAIQWVWQVPLPLQHNYYRLSESISNDRFAVLCLIPTDTNKVPPMLFRFDSLSGLQWQAKVPMQEAMLQYAHQIGVTIPNKNLKNAKIGPHLSVITAHNGSRTLVAVTMGNPCATFLFVYDAEGTLLRTLVFPEQIIYGNLTDSQMTEGLGRTLTEDRFEITFRWLPSREKQKQARFGEEITETFLMNAEGDIQQRFVGEDNLPIDIDRLSDTHALATETRKDGARLRLLYELPKVGEASRPTTPVERSK